MLFRSLEFAPRHPDALHALGVIAQRSGNSKLAADFITRAIKVAPSVAAYHNNCGEVYRALGEYDLAIDCYRKAIEINPDYSYAYQNLGIALQVQGRTIEAISACETAIAFSPNDPDAHFTLSGVLLASGDYARGWREYAWHRKSPGFASIASRLREPAWTGQPITAGTVLLYAEQGYGDAIQFIRYAPLVAERCARVLVKCHAELESLFDSVSGKVKVIKRDEPLPPFDMHAALVDMPGIFGTELNSVPASVPYLRAPCERVEAWNRKMDLGKRAFRVGLAWAGNPANSENRNRSCTLAAFAPLSEVHGVVFYGLQKGGSAQDPPGSMRFIDIGQEIGDFSDTAAVIENLDLIISVDTSVAHLAGALAKPVWTLLSFAADWRWLMNRANSPWYPTMRLFRQSRPGAWFEMHSEVATELTARVGKFME